MKTVYLALSILIAAFSLNTYACSITASGSCGGSECDDGYSCKKVSDYECDCVAKDNDNLADALEQDNAASATDVNGVLAPGESFTVLTGSEPQTFRIRLIGTIQPDANINVQVDGAIAATLTATNKATVANGNTITLKSLGRTPQGFIATRLN